MSLNEENRNIIVNHRLQKAKNTLTEAKGNIEMNFWHTTANRLYYACFYAVTALLIKYGYTTRTHNGAFGQFGNHFVNKGIITKEENRLYRKLFDLRQDGDYDDWVIITEEDIMPLIQPVENFIEKIEQLIRTGNSD